MSRKVIYWLPRLFSIFVGFVAFSYLIDLSITAGIIVQAIAIAVGLGVAGYIFIKQHQIQDDRLLALLPLSLWAGVLVYSLLGQFAGSLSLFEFVYLSIFTGTITALAYYAWENNLIGGIIYLTLGAFYLLVAWGRVSLFGIIFVLSVFSIIGFFYLIQPGERDKIATAKTDSESSSTENHIPKESENDSSEIEITPTEDDTGVTQLETANEEDQEDTQGWLSSIKQQTNKLNL